MYKYTRLGFIAGIPARDLTDEEARKYGVEKLLKSGLYVHVDDNNTTIETGKPRRRKVAEVNNGTRN